MKPGELVELGDKKIEELIEQTALRAARAEEAALYKEREGVCRALMALTHRFPGEASEEGQRVTSALLFSGGELHGTYRDIFVVAEVRHDWDDTELYSSAGFYFYAAALELAYTEGIPTVDLELPDKTTVPAIFFHAEHVPSILIDQQRQPLPPHLALYRDDLDRIKETLGVLSEVYPTD